MPLSGLEALAIAATGFFMGAINNLAGGGGALGIVAFEEFAGMPPKEADINLRPAGIAIGLSGYLGYVSRGTRVPGRAWLLGLVAVPGAVLGSLLAIELPTWVLQATLATILLVVLQQQLFPRPGPATIHEASLWRSALWFTWMGAHLGFVQVGAGLLTMLALTRLGARDLLWINAVKAAVVILTSSASVIYFAAHGRIDWIPALCLAAGAAAGSFLASRWSVDRGHGAVRVAVLVITVGILIRLLWQLLDTGPLR